MSARFTPGPWSADWWYCIIRDLHNQPGLERGDEDCFGYPGWDGDNTANAFLIAAAPELYEALEAALAIHGGGYSWGEKARAALAKARGEQ